MDLYSLSTYNFDLPAELIAQKPLSSRDDSRLMLIHRATGQIEEIKFREIVDLLDTGDSFVFNNTKVIPARLYGKKESGGRVEIFLLEEKERGLWEALARPAKKLKISSKIIFSETFFCTVVDIFEGGMVKVLFSNPSSFEENLEIHGQIPLPHYIHRDNQESLDKERYQTVFAANPGAVAAPTAGLHFTTPLLEKIQAKGVDLNYITLHVGPGTFKPVLCSDITQHPMHSERFSISEETALKLQNSPPNKKQICVGTTCCRTLESAADNEGRLIPGVGSTNIFIYPGYKFKFVSHLLTNFHLPKSTLLMLVSAFAGYDLIMEAYKKAVKDRYRFFSYGDAMLIL